MKAGAYDNRHYVKTEIWYNGALIGTGQDLVGTVRTAIANKRKRRSKPLGVSIGTWTTTTTSSAIIDATTVGKWGRVGRIGPPMHAYPTGPITFSEPDPGDIGTAANKATRRFVQNSGLGISIVESPQAARLIGRRARTLYQSIRLLGKGKFSEFAQLMRSSTGYNISDKHIQAAQKRFGHGRYTEKRASAAWLEFSFGWTPFFQSIYDSVNVALSYEKYDTHRRSASDKKTRVGFSADIVHRQRYNLNQLGLLNPAEILWDRRPLSFVIDWFLPITTLLRIASANAGLSRIHGWSTQEKSKSTFTRGILAKEHVLFYRKLHTFGFSNVFVAPSNSLWKTITSLALISSLTGR